MDAPLRVHSLGRSHGLQLAPTTKIEGMEAQRRAIKVYFYHDKRVGSQQYARRLINIQYSIVVVAVVVAIAVVVV